MSTKFITGVLAAASLIAAFAAAPARAGNDDLGKFLGTAAGLVILGHILNDLDKDGRVTVTHGYGHGHGHGGSYDPKPRPKPKAKRPPLPRKCVRNVWSEHTQKKRKVMTNVCLNRNYHAARPLPQMCKTRFWLKGKVRNGYNLRCLKGNGYRLTRN